MTPKDMLKTLTELRDKTEEILVAAHKIHPNVGNHVQAAHVQASNARSALLAQLAQEEGEKARKKK